MKRSLAVETEVTDSNTETESLLAHTPRRMSDPEIETSSSEAVTSEDVERQLRAVTDPLTQQLAHLCELMKELWDEQTHRRHEETTSSRTASTSAGSTSRSDIKRNSKSDDWENSWNARREWAKEIAKRFGNLNFNVTITWSSSHVHPTNQLFITTVANNKYNTGLETTP